MTRLSWRAWSPLARTSTSVNRYWVRCLSTASGKGKAVLSHFMSNRWCWRLKTVHVISVCPTLLCCWLRYCRRCHFVEVSSFRDRFDNICNVWYQGLSFLSSNTYVTHAFPIWHPDSSGCLRVLMYRERPVRSWCHHSSFWPI
jgi:hypothetical protein